MKRRHPKATVADDRAQFMSLCKQEVLAKGNDKVVLSTVKSPGYDKKYRLVWLADKTGIYFAAEDTTTYATREGAETAKGYVEKLLSGVAALEIGYELAVDAEMKSPVEAQNNEDSTD